MADTSRKSASWRIFHSRPPAHKFMCGANIGNPGIKKRGGNLHPFLLFNTTIIYLRVKVATPSSVVASV